MRSTGRIPAVFMTQFLQEFGSWYWHDDFDVPELDAAFVATGSATTDDEFAAAFLTLLRSGHVPAQGTALDFYDRAQATSRFGEANPFEPHADEALAVARELLEQPPTPESENVIAGANHASALLMIKYFGDDRDAAAVTRILASRPEGAVKDNALTAAGTVLLNSDTPDPRLPALLTAIVLDSDAGEGDREDALGALRHCGGDEVAGLLARVVRAHEGRLWLDAAAYLTWGEGFYAHRELLASLEFDPDQWAAQSVGEALAEGAHSLHWKDATPALHAEHAQLRTPTGKAAHIEAFLAMLRSGDTASVGIALDHFHMEDGLTRFCLDVTDLEDEVTAVARRSLAVPELRVSALHALEDLATAEDAAAIAALLLEGPGEVRGYAADVADSLLENEDPDGLEPLFAAIASVVADTDVDEDTRGEVLRPLFYVDSPRAEEVLLLGLARPEASIQVEAAIGLANELYEGRHLPRLRELKPTWPESVRHRSQWVRL